MSKFVGADNFLVCGCRQFLSLWVQIKKDWESWTLRQEKVEMGQGSWWWGGEEKSKMLTIFTQEGLSPLPAKPCFQKNLFWKQGAIEGRKYNVATIAAPPLEAPVWGGLDLELGLGLLAGLRFSTVTHLGPILLSVGFGQGRRAMMGKTWLTQMIQRSWLFSNVSKLFGEINLSRIS